MAVRNLIFDILEGPDREVRRADWSWEIRTKLSDGGVEKVRGAVHSLYSEHADWIKQDDEEVAYDIGVAAGRVYEESHVDYDALLESVQQGIPELFFSREASASELGEEVQQGMEDYLSEENLSLV